MIYNNCNISVSINKEPIVKKKPYKKFIWHEMKFQTDPLKKTLNGRIKHHRKDKSKMQSLLKQGSTVEAQAEVKGVSTSNPGFEMQPFNQQEYSRGDEAGISPSASRLPNVISHQPADLLSLDDSLYDLLLNNGFKSLETDHKGEGNAESSSSDDDLSWLLSINNSNNFLGEAGLSAGYQSVQTYQENGSPSSNHNFLGEAGLPEGYQPVQTYQQNGSPLLYESFLREVGLPEGYQPVQTYQQNGSPLLSDDDHKELSVDEPIIPNDEKRAHKSYHKWTEEEDARLSSAMQLVTNDHKSYGLWKRISHSFNELGGVDGAQLSAVQCKYRWKSHFEK